MKHCIRHSLVAPWAVLPLALAVSAAWAADASQAEKEKRAQANEPAPALGTVVVTGTVSRQPDAVRIDPKAALQPLPASDGASLLKGTPGLNVIRKGGSSGDPLLRGLGGSRLNVLADDMFIYGGCGNRMDPPTAYIFPAAFDEVVITKGPQSVTQGMGLVAGGVRFVRQPPTPSETTRAEVNAAATAGSFGRFDLFGDATITGRMFFVRANATHNKSDNYKDGSGQEVNSHFKRNSQMLQAGLMPTRDTRLSVTYERSRGEAAYADRMMDGTKFDRDAWSVQGVHQNITPWFKEAELRFGSGTIDHVMDNFSMRPVNRMMGQRLNNPKRTVRTAHFKSTLEWGNLNVQAGLDWSRDRHRARMGADYLAKPFMPTQSFRQAGAFAEAAWKRTPEQKLVAGLRHDRVRAVFERQPAASPTKNQTYKLTSAFGRWEQVFGNATWYAGLGLAERSPDFWERKRSSTLKPEKNRQIDAGVIYRQGSVQASVSLFASSVKDFILVDTNPGAAEARNIDARRYGGEAEVKWRLLPTLEAGASLAYTRGTNRSDHRPLGQTPPLELKTSLNWDNGVWSAGALWRVAAKQNRYAIGQGNIIGQDLGPTPGFGVFSINGGWRINRNVTLQAGVDNVFDKTYAESISRPGSHIDPALGVRTMRVNEPGRQFWLRVQAQF